MWNYLRIKKARARQNKTDEPDETDCYTSRALFHSRPHRIDDSDITVNKNYGTIIISRSAVLPFLHANASTESSSQHSTRASGPAPGRLSNSRHFLNGTPSLPFVRRDKGTRREAAALNTLAHRNKGSQGNKEIANLAPLSRFAIYPSQSENIQHRNAPVQQYKRAGKSSQQQSDPTYWPVRIPPTYSSSLPLIPSFL